MSTAKSCSSCGRIEVIPGEWCAKCGTFSVPHITPKSTAELEDEFLDLVREFQPAIEAKLSQAYEILTDAVELSEKSGVPFTTGGPGESLVYIPFKFFNSFKQLVVNRTFTNPELYCNGIPWDSLEITTYGWQPNAAPDTSSDDDGWSSSTCAGYT